MENNDFDSMGFNLFAPIPCKSNSPESKESLPESTNRIKSEFNLWSNCIKEQQHERKKELIDAKSGWNVSKMSTTKSHSDGQVPSSLIRKGTEPNVDNRKPFDARKHREIQETVSVLAKDLKEYRKDILRKLDSLDSNERIVKVLGKERSLQLRAEAIQIDENGGMLADGGKRRTKGGIYFQLVKHLKDIGSGHKRSIFASKSISLEKKQRKNQKKKFKKLAKKMDKVKLE